ncbi:hypothetical protein, partial [Halogeometricum borinquense]|uniref:hypothetical protein n=1 Tax=Halogeometricum borinquense TaxID=60847 RepID=UPI001A92255D
EWQHYSSPVFAVIVSAFLPVLVLDWRFLTGIVIEADERLPSKPAGVPHLSVRGVGKDRHGQITSAFASLRLQMKQTKHGRRAYSARLGAY